MAFAKGTVSLSANELLSIIPEELIVNHYFGVSKIPCLINSPLREDNNPSFSFYYSNNRIHYIDYKSSESNGVLDLMCKYFNKPLQETLTIIYYEMINSSNPNVSITKKDSEGISVSKNSDIKVEVKTREWKDWDIEYWESYGVSKKMAKWGNVYPISHVFITKDGHTNCFPADKYAYAYIEHKDGIPTIKVYQPYNKKYKWTNGHNSSIWDLWSKLPAKGEKLIITSSRKDALCLWENTHIPCTAMQGEGYIPKQKIIDLLKSRFKTIYILYDNDFQKDINTGVVSSKKLADKFGLIPITIPSEYGEKDPSDFCKKYGRQKLKELIFSLI